jgi:mercuric reductase
MKEHCCERDGPAGLQVVILGSGAAAMAAVIKATERNAQVHLVERSIIGGTCVNVGCVPSKHLVRSGQLQHWCDQHADMVDDCRCNGALDARKLHESRRELVEQLRWHKYERVLQENPRVTVWRGQASFQDAQTIRVQHSDETAAGGETLLRFDRCLIAVGATPYIPPIEGLANVPFWTSTEALESERVPQRLGVIGSSAVALELAQAYARLGSQVIIFARHGLCSRTDPLVGTTLKQALIEDGRIQVHCNVAVESVQYEQGVFTLALAAPRATYQMDALLVASGRRPSTAALNLQAAGVLCDSATGMIPIDAHLRTNIPHIYAAGDCAQMPQLVYVAAAAGTRAAIHMTGGEATLDLSVVPWVIFCEPQVAAVGLTETEAQERGLKTETRILPITSVPRSIVHGEKTGFLKLVAETPSMRILGAQAVAAEASDMISTVAVAIRGQLTVPDLASMLLPYLTASEAVKLVAQSFTRDVHQLSCCAG